MGFFEELDRIDGGTQEVAHPADAHAVARIASLAVPAAVIGAIAVPGLLAVLGAGLSATIAASAVSGLASAAAYVGGRAA